MEEVNDCIVYKIESELGNLIYCGSTENTLESRFRQHKYAYKKLFKKANRGATSYKLFDEYGVQNCKITEITSCFKSERYDLEQKQIDEYRKNQEYVCVNVINAKSKLSDEEKLRSKMYKGVPKVKCICDICKAEYVVWKRDLHNKTKNHQKHINSININITINNTLSI